ncbi:MAG: hypothetical protein QOE89_1653 [Pseudonocardiales bacterium]|nr:hypothetical protein [Pseudonocardiales bacterium]
MGPVTRHRGCSRESVDSASVVHRPVGQRAAAAFDDDVPEEFFDPLDDPFEVLPAEDDPGLPEDAEPADDDSVLAAEPLDESLDEPFAESDLAGDDESGDVAESALASEPDAEAFAGTFASRLSLR